MYYVMSDIHGRYDLYLRMLQRLDLKDSDLLILLGDYADRGPEGIRVMQDVMARKNAVPLLGNHEDMFRRTIRGWGQRMSLREKRAYQRVYLNWTVRNGGAVTWEAFQALPRPDRRQLRDWLENLPAWMRVSAGGRNFLLVHAGVGSWVPEKDPADCSLHDLIWYRMDYDRQYYRSTLLVTGHTPTFFIDPACRGRILRRNNHIVIDCGAVYTGALGCLCLDTLEAFYVE